MANITKLWTTMKDNPKYEDFIARMLSKLLEVQIDYPVNPKGTEIRDLDCLTQRKVQKDSEEDKEPICSKRDYKSPSSNNYCLINSFSNNSEITINSHSLKIRVYRTLSTSLENY